jgi:transcriptional regulator with XRE-family HTH domain
MSEPVERIDERMTFGEYLRRVRRRRRVELQQLALRVELSLSYLSRIENDKAVPSPDVVVKLAAALDGDMDRMLELAGTLPQAILDRLIRRANDDSSSVHRGSGHVGEDARYPEALVNDMDPQIRQILAQHFGFSERDVDGIYTALQAIGQMEPDQREAVLTALVNLFRATERRTA